MKVRKSCSLGDLPLSERHPEYAQVYIAAIVGHVPNRMVQCIASFIKICYIFRRNAITATALKAARNELSKFYELQKVFIDTGTRSHCSLPRQHSLMHFIRAILDFGSPNGLCSSITESRHITAVKEPWRRSNRYEALSQMLTIINRMDKMLALRCALKLAGLMRGSTTYGVALALTQQLQAHTGGTADDEDDNPDNEHDGDDDEMALAGAGSSGDIDDNDEFVTMDEIAPESGPRLASSVTLSATRGV